MKKQLLLAAVLLYIISLSSEIFAMQAAEKEKLNKELKSVVLANFPIWSEWDQPNAWEQFSPEVVTNYPFIETTSRLIQQGADPDTIISDTAWETWLHRIAPLDKYSPLVEYLLKSGASPKSLNRDDETPLHHAAMGGAPKNTHLLLQSGANVHSLNCINQTSMSQGVLRMLIGEVRRRRKDPIRYENYLETAKILLSAGADPEQDSCGGTAIEMAEHYNLTEFSDLFKETPKK